MTEKEELRKIAQDLIGTWIYDKTDSDEYLYAYDLYDWEKEKDLQICCIAINPKDVTPYVQEKEIWASEIKEYFRKLSADKGLKAWERIKSHYDKMFKGE